MFGVKISRKSPPFLCRKSPKHFDSARIKCNTPSARQKATRMVRDLNSTRPYTVQYRSIPFVLGSFTVSSSKGRRHGTRASPSSARLTSRKFRPHDHHTLTLIRCSACSEALNSPYRYNMRFFLSLILPGFFAIATVQASDFQLKTGSRVDTYTIQNCELKRTIKSDFDDNTQHTARVNDILCKSVPSKDDANVSLAFHCACVTGTDCFNVVDDEQRKKVPDIFTMFRGADANDNSTSIARGLKEIQAEQRRCRAQ